MRIAVAVLAGLLLATPAFAVEPFPASFKTQTIKTNGTELYVRVGGQGPAVVLLHGFGDTGDMWAPIAAKLVANHTVIVPDLRGMGLSAHPDTGYTKANEARDIAGVMDTLKVHKAQLVTHDIGNMVGYALAAQYPARITRWVVIDAPLPGVGATGRRNCPIPRPGISISMVPTRNGWWRGASASISTASITNCRRIPKRSMRRHASITPPLCPAARHT